MLGTILEIDTYENIGVLADKENNEYTFSLDDCVGFEDTPQIDEVVEFGVNSGEVFFVEPTFGKDENEEIEDDAFEQTEQREYIKEDISEEFIEAKDRRRKPLQLQIPLTASIMQCIEEYFQDITYYISDFEVEFEEFEELNYPLMKRFLNTAYNNLADMDSTFMDEELLAVRADLNSLDEIYTKLVKKESVPSIAYENVFLSRQSVYKTNKKRIESNTSEIYTVESTVKPLEEQIKNLTKKISNEKHTKDTIASWERDLKRFKTYYVDSLHKLGTLKEENIQLKASLLSFEKKYEREFLELFEIESRKYNKVLRRQLDGYAYVFDQMLWEKAETSHAIISFFKKAHIEENFSSKTFLKYFIKSLDVNKMSKELKRLQALLIYLENRAKLKVFIVDENFVEGDRIKHIIRQLDKEYNVENLSKPRSIYYRKDLKAVDFIFVEYGLKNPPVLEFLSMLQTRLRQTGSKAQLCLVSKHVNKEILKNMKNLKINHFFALTVSDEELQENIQDLIQNA